MDNDIKQYYIMTKREIIEEVYTDYVARLKILEDEAFKIYHHAMVHESVEYMVELSDRDFFFTTATHKALKIAKQDLKELHKTVNDMEEDARYGKGK